MLNRPISEFYGPVDSLRMPVLPVTGDCKPFQEVLIELASKLKSPAFVDENGNLKYKYYPDFIINYKTAKDSGIACLAGWCGKNSEKQMKGEPNKNQ